MDLAELQRRWDRFGRTDPLWAVLSEPERRQGRWDPEEFFATGRREVEEVLARIDGLGVPLRRGRCLDFGCGVGRVTQAFAAHFEEVDGVDIAPSMIDQARSFNTAGEGCRYHVNGADDLRLFPDRSFDLVYSRLVLMHIPPEYGRRYIAEFMRVLAPGGLAVFQVPSEWRSESTEEFALGGGAYRAAITVESAPRVVAGGAVGRCRVRVRNDGDRAWPRRPLHHLGIGQVTLGNHWKERGGRMVVQDDARSGLPHDLAPGAETVLSLGVTAPARPGVYTLELDMVQEGVCWFARHGSPPAVARVLVRPGRSRPDSPAHPATEDAADAVFHMHGIPQEQVLALVVEGGCVLVAALEEPGEGWRSHQYHVRRPA